MDDLLKGSSNDQGATIPFDEIQAYDALDDIGPQANKELDILARFTTIDGAVVIGSNLRPLAIGSKLKPILTNNPPLSILVTEPIEGREPTIESFVALGGTRHQSAARFVNDQRDALVIVASVDNKLSFMRWDKQKEMVFVLRHAEMALFS